MTTAQPSGAGMPARPGRSRRVAAARSRGGIRAGALAVALALAACGDTLVDHDDTSIRQGGQPVTCTDPGQLLCGNACKAQGVGPDLVCGDCSTQCLADGAPANATAACNPTADGQGRFCDFDCAAGLLKTTSPNGCVPPALVAAGGEFSCATAAGTGAVHCWGANDHGQLGPGVAAAFRATSSRVRSAVLAGVTALAAGPTHACASVSGTVYCWGDARGFGATQSSATPVEVPALSGSTALSAGLNHTCGIASGALRCTGAATDGGGVPALGGTVLEVSAGDSFSCALVAGSPSDLVRCWGANDHAQHGTGGTGAADGNPTTVAFPAGLAIRHVAAGARHACASTSDATRRDLVIYCWGDNTSGQLGVNAGGSVGAPTPIKTNKVMSTAVPVVLAAGGVASCGVIVDAGDTLSCWSGDETAAGGAGAALGEPIPLTSMSPPGRFSMGGDHSCIVSPAGLLASWGHNAHGQLGDGTTTTPAAGTFVTVVDR